MSHGDGVTAGSSGALPGAPPAPDDTPRCYFSIDQDDSPEELRRRTDNLQVAVEKASGHVRTLQITLLSLGAYLTVVFGSTTHEQLLRESPVNLPLLGVDLKLVSFYWIAPFLFVLLHFNLLLQAHLLHPKLKRLHDNAFNLPLQGSLKDQIERARLDSFPLTQMLAANIEDRSAHFFTSNMTWMTFAFLPIALLLVAQGSFLPYHDGATTCWHRLLIVVDLGLLLVIWMRVADLSGAKFFWEILWPFGQRRTDSSGQPTGFPRHLKWNWFSMALTIVIAIPLSFALLTIPGERLDGITGETKLSFVPRNLEVREANLVGSWPTQEQINQYGEDLAWQNFGAPPNLRDRDLRYADLSRSILAHGDLRGADLRGAQLSLANLQGANLRAANLQNAVLTSANLQGANLGAAELQGANLTSGKLQGLSLPSANLQGAVLWHANLQGADFESADLQGADLRDARLQGAALSCDTLGNCVKLQGAVLRSANLQGTVFRHADLRGADLRGTHFWRAIVYQHPDSGGSRWALADMRGAKFNPIQNLDVWIDEETKEIGEADTRTRVAERLWAALRNDDRPDLPLFSGLTGMLSGGPGAMFDAGNPVVQRLGWGRPLWDTEEHYDQGFAEFLGELSCGSAATTSMALAGARRALQEAEDLSRWERRREPPFGSVRIVRMYAKRLAERIVNDCPPAAGLPDDLRAELRGLAGG